MVDILSRSQCVDNEWTVFHKSTCSEFGTLSFLTTDMSCLLLTHWGQNKIAQVSQTSMSVPFLYWNVTFIDLNITMTSQRASWRFISPASWLLAQLPFQAQIKENIKSPRHCPLWGESTGHRGPDTGKMSPFDDVIMNALDEGLSTARSPAII